MNSLEIIAIQKFRLKCLKKVNKPATLSLMDQKIKDWLPLVLIFTGFFMTWIGLDNKMMIVNSGFCLHGVLGVSNSLKNKYYQKVSLKLVKLIGQLVIMLIAIMNILTGDITILPLLLLIISDNFLLSTKRLEE